MLAYSNLSLAPRDLRITQNSYPFLAVLLSDLRSIPSPSELSRWEFVAPATAIDRGTHQAVYRLYIDLRAVSDSCDDPEVLASFLQRRRSPPLPELAVSPKSLLQVCSLCKTLCGASL